MSHQDRPLPLVINHQTIKQVIDWLLAPAVFASLPGGSQATWKPRLLAATALEWATSELSTLHERFVQARKIIKKVFRWHPAPGESSQGFLKMLAQWQPELRGAVVPHLREQMQEMHRAQWETGGDAVFAGDGTRVNAVPLNAAHPELRVNFLEYWEVHADHVQHWSWVTDLRVHHATVETLMRGGRARGKIENETFNTLKNQGSHFAHNSGHGTQQLSVVLAMLMMLAFLVDQTQQLCCALFRAVAEQWGSNRGLWERLRALFFAYALTSMRQLLEALVYGFKQAAPQLALDSS